MSKPKPKLKKLTQAEEKRAEKLRGLLATLEAGSDVQNRALQTWLTADEYAAMQSDWQQQLAIRDDFAEKPYQIQEYEERLRRAIFLENRTHTYSKLGKKKGTKALGSAAESEFEDLLTYLEEIVTEDPGLRVWFDRTLDFEAGSELSTDSTGIPRIITSRSAKNSSSSFMFRKLSKREIKMQAVKLALDNLTLAESEPDSKNADKLKKLLNLPWESDDF